MLLGTFFHSLDAKGRVFLPAKWRQELSDEVIVTRGQEKCLFVITSGRFGEIAEQMAGMSETKKDMREYGRMFYGAASEEQVDRQGRMNVPAPLREYAGLSKEVVLVGAGKRVEIWDRGAWQQHLSQIEGQYEEITERLEV
ncbi:MAG TPA: division/cell wall cluster transcriptional repressor MraZ [Actinomycetota bacterium]|nr:division/cell wall cluster transcriptional repressor MraZ [Actinomycetota bacterium]